MDFRTELLEYLHSNYNMGIHENGRIATFDLVDMGYELTDCEQLSIDVAIGDEDDNGLRIVIVLSKLVNKHWSMYLSQMPLFDGYIGDISDINPLIAMTGLKDILLSEVASQQLLDALQKNIAASVQIIASDKSIYGDNVNYVDENVEDTALSLLKDMIESQHDDEHECDCCDWKEYDLNKEELELVVESYRDIIDKIIHKVTVDDKLNKESIEERCVEMVESISKYLDCINDGGSGPWPEIDSEARKWIDDTIDIAENEDDAIKITKALKAMFDDLLNQYEEDNDDLLTEDIIVDMANSLKDPAYNENMVHKGICLAEQSRVDKLIEASTDTSTVGK